jgi:hypothetical protein
MPALRAADLRAIARYQRLLILCLVVELLMWVGYVAVVGSGWHRDNGEGAVLLLVWTAAVGLVGAIGVFLLSLKVSGPITGVLLAALTIVPCFGLLTLLIANLQATRALREHRIGVGLFGASRSDLTELGSRLDDLGSEEDEGW